jgi:hypothetical protein
VLRVEDDLVWWRTSDGDDGLHLSHVDAVNPISDSDAAAVTQAALHTAQQPDGWAPWRAAGADRCGGAP